jgi:hypothetical protein
MDDPGSALGRNLGGPVRRAVIDYQNFRLGIALGQLPEYRFAGLFFVIGRDDD